LLDPFAGHRQETLDASDFNFLKESGVFPDIIDLTENAPTMAETFTIEMWIWSDQHGDEHQRIIGPSPRISLRGKIANGNAELSYGFNKTGPPKHRNIRINKVGWYHIAMTFDTNGDFIFYLDGEEVSRTDRLRVINLGIMRVEIEIKNGEQDILAENGAKAKEIQAGAHFWEKLMMFECGM